MCGRWNYYYVFLYHVRFFLLVALPLLKNSSTCQDSEPEIEDQIADGEKKKGKGNILLLDLHTFSFSSSPARSPIPNAFFRIKFNNEFLFVFLDIVCISLIWVLVNYFIACFSYGQFLRDGQRSRKSYYGKQRTFGHQVSICFPLSC